MKTLHFEIKIKAPRERVWNILWEDKTFRDWASIIDEGTYMIGEMKEGNEVQFISSVNGYGVTSLIEKLAPNEHVLFRQMADTKDSGEREREKEWTGGAESYSLAENNDVTTLTADIDVPPGQEETFKVRFPKALERVKILAENMSVSIENQKDVTLQFNEAITNRDIDRLAVLMTDDHAFIDSANTEFRGKDKALQAWRGFFEAFPKYKNVFDRVEAKADKVVMLGHSICPNNKELDGPAIWTAKVNGGKLAEWRVYEDTPENRKQLGVTG
jgi:ketosteroid isomerase-like protein